MERLLTASYRIWRWSLPLAALVIVAAWLAGAVFVLLAVWRGILAWPLAYRAGMGVSALLWLAYPLAFRAHPGAPVEGEWLVVAAQDAIDEWRAWMTGLLRLADLLTGWGGILAAITLAVAFPFGQRLTQLDPGHLALLVASRSGAAVVSYALVATLSALLTGLWRLLALTQEAARPAIHP